MKPETKCRMVSNAIYDFYRRKDIETITELGIRKKVNRDISTLNKILKFKSKTKSDANIQYETSFKQKLTATFPVEKDFYGFIPEEINSADTSESNQNELFVNTDNSVVDFLDNEEDFGNEFRKWLISSLI